MPTYLPKLPNVFRVKGLGLCTLDSVAGRPYWRPLDQNSKLWNSRCGIMAGRFLEGSDVFRLFRGQVWSNECHHTQRQLFRAMSKLEGCGHYATLNPDHATTN